MCKNHTSGQTGKGMGLWQLEQIVGDREDETGTTQQDCGID